MTRRQIQLRELGYQVYLQKRPVVMVFEGWDAAGKGGAIKRITEKLDPRGYVVYPISAPQGEDKTRHYLYRFWRRLPERGQIAIFDRSWYGRVLVERVEGFAEERGVEARVTRRSIPSSASCATYGTIVAKFWIHISREEQLRRFEERKAIGYKAWKLTDEDWRNREKWGAYEEAVEEMLVKTSTAARPGPWWKATTNTGRARSVVQAGEDPLDRVGVHPRRSAKAADLENRAGMQTGPEDDRGQEKLAPQHAPEGRAMTVWILRLPSEQATRSGVGVTYSTEPGLPKFRARRACDEPN